MSSCFTISCVDFGTIVSFLLNRKAKFMVWGRDWRLHSIHMLSTQNGRALSKVCLLSPFCSLIAAWDHSIRFEHCHIIGRDAKLYFNVPHKEYIYQRSVSPSFVGCPQGHCCLNPTDTTSILEEPAFPKEIVSTIAFLLLGKKWFPSTLSHWIDCRVLSIVSPFHFTFTSYVAAQELYIHLESCGRVGRQDESTTCILKVVTV